MDASSASGAFSVGSAAPFSSVASLSVWVSCSARVSADFPVSPDRLSKSSGTVSVSSSDSVRTGSCGSGIVSVGSSESSLSKLSSRDHFGKDSPERLGKIKNERWEGWNPNVNIDLISGPLAVHF